jgi:hypothetical protein
MLHFSQTVAEPVQSFVELMVLVVVILHITRLLLNSTRKMLVFHAQLKVILELVLKHLQIVVDATLVTDMEA